MDFETTGVDFCTHDRFLSSDFALCSFANYPDKVAKDELLSVPAQPLSCIIVHYRAVSRIIVQNRSLLPKIGKNNWLVFWKEQRNVVTLHRISEGDTGLAKP